MKTAVRPEVKNEPLRLVLAHEEMAYIVGEMKKTLRELFLAVAFLAACFLAVGVSSHYKNAYFIGDGHFRDSRGTIITDESGTPVTWYDEAEKALYGPFWGRALDPGRILGVVGAFVGLMWIASTIFRYGKLMTYRNGLRRFLEKHHRSLPGTNTD